MKKYFFILLGFFFVQCAGSRMAEIYNNYNSDDYIYWAENKKLTWADFQGIPIESVDMVSESYFHMPSSVEKINLFAKTKIVVICVFDKKSSWVKREALTSNGLLFHQVLFNIYELYARKFRRDLKESNNSSLNLTEKFHQLNEKNNRLLIEETQRYRSETKNGLDALALIQWDETIMKELHLLESYKMNHIK